MNTAKFLSVMLLVIATAKGQPLEADRTFNLKDIHVLSAQAIGRLLLLSFTNQAPALSFFTRQNPKPLKSEEPPVNRSRIQVLFGRDVIGFAKVLHNFDGISQD